MRPVVLVATLIVTGCASDLERGARLDHDGVVHFYGDIDDKSVAAFIARHDGEHVERVVLNSGGGDVGEGIRLGNWILDRGADVEVEGWCGSSCANYLFPAGRRKIIDDGGIVIWHGSLLQKNFREACSPVRPNAVLYQLGLDPEDCEVFRDLAARQEAFFARVGVDEYLTRLGQEPHAFESAWTVPVAVMERFGLTGVEASADYGTHATLARFNHDGDEHPVLMLGFDERGNVVELAR